MGTNGKRYENVDELRAATLEAAAEGWKEAAGRDLTDRDRANFIDREQPIDEQMAAEIAADLSDALTRAADFDRAHRAAYAEEGSDRPRRIRDDEDGPMARGLLSFVERFLPFLIGANRFAGDARLAAENGQVDVDLALLKRMRDRPSVVAALPHLNKGWGDLSINHRVVELLGEKTERGYWRMFGLSEPPTAKTMAYAALLLGQFPSVTLPARVSDVIEKAATAIRAHTSRRA